MFRRVVARLLVLLLFLPGTWAAHAHAGTSAHDPSGSDRAPHFHLRVFYVSWQQYPSGQNVHFHHWHDEGKALTGSKPATDHDDDAVYLPVSVLLGWCSDPPVDLGNATELAMLAGTVRLPDVALIKIPPQESSPPAARWHACPLYLRSLTLLI
jgi:hypothetical protein